MRAGTIMYTYAVHPERIGRCLGAAVQCIACTTWTSEQEDWTRVAPYLLWGPRCTGHRPHENSRGVSRVEGGGITGLA